MSPDVTLIRAAAHEEGEAFAHARENALALRVDSEAGFTLAEEITREILRRRDGLEAKLDAWTKPLKDLIKLARDDVKPRLDAATEVIGILKTKCVGYRADVARLRAQAEQDAQKALTAQAPVEVQRAALVAVAEAVAPKTEGISYRDNWIATVVDAAIVPDRYCYRAVDEKLVSEAVKAGERVIPGVLIENRPIMTVRR